MGETATTFGAEILGYAIGIALIWGCYAAGRWATYRTGRQLAGWGLGLGLFVFAAVLIGPTWNALKQVKCDHSADRSACIEGQGGQDY